MFYLISEILARIVSNSYLNVFQKILTNKGQKSSVVNFYTYLGLTIITLPFVSNINLTSQIIENVIIMGLLGALGNYFIIKALSVGELSALAPINSYKPIVALIIGIFYLKEIPDFYSLIAIFFIIFGTYFVINCKGKINKRALLYRVLALIFSGVEAVFIKKLIIITDINQTLFLWALSGFLFSALFLIAAKYKPKIVSLKYQILLILAVGIMQYSTNYVFSKMNVSYALALFQLSTLLSVFLGVNIFGESGLKQKLTGAVIMIIGAIILLLR